MHCSENSIVTPCLKLVRPDIFRPNHAQDSTEVRSRARFISFLASLSSGVRYFLCFFAGASTGASPLTSACFLFTFLEGRLSSFGIPRPAVSCGASFSLSESPSVPTSPPPKPVGRKRILRPFSCGLGARMVDRVMEAAASEPVFWSACFDVRCGSCTTAWRWRVCDIRAPANRESAVKTSMKSNRTYQPSAHLSSVR
jgi:hypothetical protein